MGRFDKYKVDLKGLRTDSLELEFNLDNRFFSDIDGQEFQKGTIKAHVSVKKKHDVFNFVVITSGIVIVPCDRCLDEMDINIETKDEFQVKFGTEYTDDGDIVVIPEEDGEINLAWYLYEFIALGIPMKHVHAPGKCNREMSGKLKKHICTSLDDDDDIQEEQQIDDESFTEATDPRWDELKNIQINEEN